MGKQKLTVEEFIKRAKVIHGDEYDYSKVVYENRKTKVEIICPQHGLFWQTPDNHLRGQGCSHNACRSRKRIATNIERYGCENVMQDDSVKSEQKKTLFSHFGECNPMKVPSIKQKQRESQKSVMMERYGYDSVGACPELRQRAVVSVENRFGVDNVMKLKKYQDRMMESKRKNGTFSSSKCEEELYGLLCNAFDRNDVVRQYRSELYPYACDFYISSRDLYIELNGVWDHGFHWFNADSKEDAIELDRRIEKAEQGSDRYAKSIYTWTDLDVKKRNIARSNSLNYVTFWDCSLRDAELWFSMGCPDGQDWLKEYSWLK